MALKEKRNNQLITMRKQGMTYEEIGRYFGIGGGRARQIVIWHEKVQEIAAKWPLYGLLPVSARTILNRACGESAFENPELVVKLGKMNLLKTRNCGIITVMEIEAALIQLGYIKDGQEW